MSWRAMRDPTSSSLAVIVGSREDARPNLQSVNKSAPRRSPQWRIKMDRRSFVIGTAAAAAAGPAFAQDAYPSHAITIINAFPPGGVNDLVTRPLATAMEPI